MCSSVLVLLGIGIMLWILMLAAEVEPLHLTGPVVLVHLTGPVVLVLVYLVSCA